MPPLPDDVTALLRLVQGGDRQARDDLFRLVENELRKRAKARLSRERPGHGLQTTELIDETFLKLLGGTPVTWEGRSHFYASAARAMRQILIDQARRKTG